MADLSDRKFLILATDRFEESELFGPKDILERAGATVELASIKTDPIQATVHDELGKTIKPDMTLADVDIADYDALILPGGVGNPDRLRTEAKAIDIIKDFDRAGKPIGAICHGPWLLIEADVLRGKTATSWPSIRTDLKNAGAEVVDQSAAVDGNIVTSRNPDDVADFTDALVQLVNVQAKSRESAL